jgi:hypothetical protein
LTAVARLERGRSRHRPSSVERTHACVPPAGQSPAPAADRSRSRGFPRVSIRESKR